VSIVSTCISIPAGTIAGVIGSCITGAMLSSVAQDLNAVEDRLDDRRKALREVQLRLALLEGQLDNWSKSKDKLVSAINTMEGTSSYMRRRSNPEKESA